MYFDVFCVFQWAPITILPPLGVGRGVMVRISVKSCFSVSQTLFFLGAVVCLICLARNPPPFFLHKTVQAREFHATRFYYYTFVCLIANRGNSCAEYGPIVCGQTPLPSRFTHLSIIWFFFFFPFPGNVTVHLYPIPPHTSVLYVFFFLCGCFIRLEITLFLPWYLFIFCTTNLALF